jgi:hypothetical protein
MHDLGAEALDRAAESAADRYDVHVVRQPCEAL